MSREILRLENVSKRFGGIVVADNISLSLHAGDVLGLIGPNGAVNLVRTTTLAAYHNGQEHYITAFSFQGGGGKFGSIIPLPGVPASV